MNIKVSFLGEIRSLAGRRDMEITLSNGNSVEDLLIYLRQKLGEEFAKRLFDTDGSLYSHVLIFVNGRNIREFEGIKTPLTGGNVDVMILPVWDGG